MLADVPSSEQITDWTSIEWRLKSAVGPWDWNSSWPEGPAPLALPPNVALSPSAVRVRPPYVTLQPTSLPGRTQVLVAVALGSVPFWAPLLSVSANAVIVSPPGSAEV